jgi:hypothetical protein
MQDFRIAYRRILGVWWDTFEPVAPTIKHRAFHEEQEWRLISTPVLLKDRRWRVRAGRSMLIPYIPITLAPSDAYLPIRDVVIGPTPHMELAVKAAGILLNPLLEPMTEEERARQPFRIANLGLPVCIRGSQIPYRNW